MAKDTGTRYFTPSCSASKYRNIGGGSFWIFNPIANINNYDDRELHDASLVVLFEKGANSILFCGDASDWALDCVRNQFEIAKVHILHASHHASINGANLEFIQEAAPNNTIISTASGVYENVPHRIALRRYRENTERDVIRTDTNGTIVFS